MKLSDVLTNAPEDSIITDSFVITDAKIKRYKKIMCSISGGSDSDIMIDLCQKLNNIDNIKYVFFDTGLEFEATKRHLLSLEKKYNVTIERVKAIKPIPICCKEFGQPFVSKQVSEWISRLQRHNFQWEDEPLEILLERYPGCRAALRWWCNDFKKSKTGRESSFNIAYNQLLKEFIMDNPPKFAISNKCCYYAKKKVASSYMNKGEFDLNMYGVRKAERGARKSAYKSCFSENIDGCDEYRPIFWYLSDNKNTYEAYYNIKHSDCYEVYGLKRTGCAGCPFGRNFEDELKVMKKYEPLIFKAVNNIFHDSYEYTRKYRKYVEEKRNKSEK